jgi:hypothetical protein
MRKIATILCIGLMVLAVVASAFASGSPALLNTNWTGEVTIISYHATDGNVTTVVEDNATLTFTGQKGDFFAGTLTLKKSPLEALEFTCVRDGRSLIMTAPGHLMAAEIFLGHPVKKGARPPQHMVIQGRSVVDGTMFEGTLTKTKQ